MKLEMTRKEFENAITEYLMDPKWELGVRCAIEETDVEKELVIYTGVYTHGTANDLFEEPESEEEQPTNEQKEKARMLKQKLSELK